MLDVGQFLLLSLENIEMAAEMFTQIESLKPWENICKHLSRRNTSIQLNFMDFLFYRLGSDPPFDS